ncbi:TPA: nitrate/nitrite two-component system sensor histidine kinase NarX [Serratia marcescens]|uniref:Sensor protein n=5 Tax=Serratia TaxID=613 RepID=A0ABW8QFM1_9GAMM|nr:MULTISPECIES: nitrate/nitrite two-component system sensor histidine kinase NarX [Serratia]ASM07758.1 nitrate/nitrite two-component system sensor histidine kinase [Serratia marcescens]AVD63543.1 nitrate/nitrite two-component system sensor histidine kinase NarX [Serratia marcescens]AWC72631.1 nitrate/nitrite two-component system sensor histidine kinase NarX [Serratia marcescens]AWC77393.1 nitrate/nitrite two-component system sensor histidine kinase NarX [Serratia marcescens]AWC90604.1 nitrate
MKRLLAPLSIVNQVALLMLLSGILGVAGMGISAWMSQSIQGNAHAINKAGSLRMQSYRLLAQVPLDERHEALIRELERDENSPDLQRSVEQEGLTQPFDALRDYWQQTLQPRLRSAQRPADAAPQVAHFVQLLDKLVSDIDRQTERRLLMVTLVQAGFIALTLLLLIGTTCYLRRRLLHPWRQLVEMALAVGRGDFSRRFAQRGHQDEMASLGGALNTMSDELSATYSGLEQRVAEKTADLQQKNQVLSFLYRASRLLHASEPLCSRLTPLLNQLQTLTPLRAIQVRLYENDSREPLLQLSGNQPLRPEHCHNPVCSACLNDSDRQHPDNPSLSWSLSDKLGDYGVIVAQHAPQQPLNDEHRQLINTLVEQLTSVLAIERQVDHQQQLMLMEERAAIARELHDSIAQSLSCLKMQIACLQMQGETLSSASQALVQQMREELNGAYRQLRELLTTFRLQLTEPGLLAALQSTVAEFNPKLGLTISLDYQLGPRTVPAYQAIHLLQIAREALSNILKHAAASEVSIQVINKRGEVTLSVCDNGRGLPAETSRPDHYGLIIMRDRAKSLHGRCNILPRSGGGTEVRVSFTPDNHAID